MQERLSTPLLLLWVGLWGRRAITEGGGEGEGGGGGGGEGWREGGSEEGRK